MSKDYEIRTYILIASIYHPEAPWNRSKLRESQLLIEMAGRCIRSDYGIELQYPEPELNCPLHAVTHEGLPCMRSPAAEINRVACIAYMAAPADIVRMEDVEPKDTAIILRNSRVALRGEEESPGLRGEDILLRKGIPLLHHFIPYLQHPAEILSSVLSYLYPFHICDYAALQTAGEYREEYFQYVTPIAGRRYTE